MQQHSLGKILENTRWDPRNHSDWEQARPVESHFKVYTCKKHSNVETKSNKFAVSMLFNMPGDANIFFKQLYD